MLSDLVTSSITLLGTGRKLVELLLGLFSVRHYFLMSDMILVASSMTSVVSSNRQISTILNFCEF